MQILKDKRIYDEFAKGEHFPVYGQAWYLDALLGENGWCALLVLSKEEDILASFAFPAPSGRLRSVKNLPGLPYFYLHINKSSSPKRHRQYRSEQHLVRFLFQNMPSYRLLDMELYPDVGSPLAFSLLGFKVQYRMTYRFLAEMNSLDLFNGLESASRGHLRRAEGLLDLEDSQDYKGFYRALNEHFKRKGLSLNMSEDCFIRLCRSLNKRDLLQLRLAKNKEGLVHGGQFRILDRAMIRLSFSFISEEGKESRAAYLLIWDLIQEACQNNKKIDLEGSMAPTIEQFYRSFGAEQCTYFRVSHCRSFLLSMALEAKRLLF